MNGGSLYIIPGIVDIVDWTNAAYFSEILYVRRYMRCLGHVLRAVTLTLFFRTFRAIGECAIVADVYITQTVFVSNHG